MTRGSLAGRRLACYCDLACATRREPSDRRADKVRHGSWPTSPKPDPQRGARRPGPAGRSAATSPTPCARSPPASAAFCGRRTRTSARSCCSIASRCAGRGAGSGDLAGSRVIDRALADPATGKEAATASRCGLALVGKRRWLHSSISGLAPTDRLDHEGATYFCSRLDPLARAAPGRLSVDWDAWASIVILRFALGARTPFVEIERLPPFADPAPWARRGAGRPASLAVGGARARPRPGRRRRHMGRCAARDAEAARRRADLPAQRRPRLADAAECGPRSTGDARDNGARRRGRQVRGEYRRPGGEHARRSPRVRRARPRRVPGGLGAAGTGRRVPVRRPRLVGPARPLGSPAPGRAVLDGGRSSLFPGRRSASIPPPCSRHQPPPRGERGAVRDPLRRHGHAELALAERFSRPAPGPRPRAIPGRDEALRGPSRRRAILGSSTGTRTLRGDPSTYPTGLLGSVGPGDRPRGARRARLVRRSRPERRTKRGGHLSISAVVERLAPSLIAP